MGGGRCVLFPRDGHAPYEEALLPGGDPEGLLPSRSSPPRSVLLSLACREIFRKIERPTSCFVASNRLAVISRSGRARRAVKFIKGGNPLRRFGRSSRKCALTPSSSRVVFPTSLILERKRKKNSGIQVLTSNRNVQLESG